MGEGMMKLVRRDKSSKAYFDKIIIAKYLHGFSQAIAKVH
jgi:hypothetical protein